MLKPAPLWRDTLLVRLLVLLWATLVLSHTAAFLVVTQLAIPLTKPRMEPSHSLHAAHNRPSVVFPSLPPADMPVLQESSTTPSPGLPLPILLLDYGIRLVVMGLGAWWGARWISRPVKRLISAAQAMTTALEQGQEPTVLDARGDTVEAQQAAAIFNQLSGELYRAFRSRELLFATVSHDLRTPMTRIRLRLESEPGPKELTQCIQDIAHMDHMVDSALTMLRQHTQHQACQPVRMDVLLQALIDDCEDMELPVFWSVASTDAAVTAMADPLALRRVLDNVVHNALRHATDVRLTLRQEPQTSTVVIVVEDNGSAIAAPQLKQLERMLKTGSYNNAVPNWTPEGNGLGLYIARDLMRLQGGSINLENRTEGEGGLRVTIRLSAAR